MEGADVPQWALRMSAQNIATLMHAGLTQHRLQHAAVTTSAVAQLVYPSTHPTFPNVFSMPGIDARSAAMNSTSVLNLPTTLRPLMCAHFQHKQRSDQLSKRDAAGWCRSAASAPNPTELDFPAWRPVSARPWQQPAVQPQPAGSPEKFARRQQTRACTLTTPLSTTWGSC